MQVLSKTGSLTALAAGIAMAITGCASSPDKIAAASTSPIQYQNHSFTQVASEMERINRRASDLYGSLKKKADDDAAQMAIGMVLF
ncbi:MAG: hypothetical protein HXY26_10590 [Hydrogenophilaceae bacterium]|nr:hypothetical protein [Hydrogenophilaceae bacterium]